MFAGDLGIKCEHLSYIDRRCESELCGKMGNLFSSNQTPVNDRFSWFIFLLLAAMLPGLTACDAHTAQARGLSKPAGIPTFQPAENPDRGPQTVTATISAVGDLMCSYRQFRIARMKGHDFDFYPSHQMVRPLLAGADFTLGNLETNMGGAGRAYSGFPRFNTPDDYLGPLREAGFDFLFTSNNHSLDLGEDGILRTIRKLDELGIGHTGTFVSEEDRNRVRIVDVKGIKLGLLSYTSTTNGIKGPRGKKYLVNYVNFRQLPKDIAAARKQGAEVVLTYFHFGTQYSSKPNFWQERVVKAAIAGGADIILGSHPHVVQPVRFFKTENARLDSGVICFSLGNFLSNEFRRRADAGVIMNLRLTRDLAKDSIYLSAVDFVPTWTYRGTHPAMRRHVILPAEWGYGEHEFAFLGRQDKARMRQAFNDTKAVLTRETDRIKVRGMNPEPDDFREGVAVNLDMGE
jgi:poly-gamma-glutamate capsule biosynthesis protein CapA/YwtB (metallophosphatase superfamily)